MCFTVQLSMFIAVSDSFDILSCCFLFVKNFFNFFKFVFFLTFSVSEATLIFYHCCSQMSRTFFNFFRSYFLSWPVSQTQLWHHTIAFFICQQVFSFFLIFLSYLDYSSDGHYPMPYRSWQVQMFIMQASVLSL